MTDYTELKRLATRIVEVQTSQDVPISKLFDDFEAAACPETILALIAENGRLLKLLERMVEQYVPLTELEGVPGWSQVVKLCELEAERDQLKAENEALRKERDARHPFKPFHEPSIGFSGCVICGVYTDHGGLPCPKTRATADAAMGQGEQS